MIRFFSFCILGILFLTSAKGQVNDSTATDTLLIPVNGLLNETVVTGMAQPVRLKNALATYYVISKSQAQAQGAVTLAEALTTQLNIKLDNDQILGTGIKLLNLSGNRVKIMIDGLPVNGREGGNIDLNQISLYNMDRIEVVQGPMSVVYGTDAIGGVVNLITRRSHKPWELGGVFNYETVGQYNFSLNGGYSYRNSNFALSAGRNFFDGWKFIDTSYDHRVMLFKPKEQYFGTFDYAYNSRSGFRLRFTSDLIHELVTDRDSAHIYSSEAYGRDNYYTTNRANNRLLLEGKRDNLSWQLSNGYAYYHRLRQQVRKDLVSLEEIPTTSENQDTSVFNDIDLRGMLTNTWNNLSLTFGYDVTMSYGISNKITGGRARYNDYALFLLAGYVVNKKVTLQAGLRGDNNTRTTTPVLPSLNLLFNPSDAFQLRASYAHGFRVPSLKELYLFFHDGIHQIEGNEDLRPENGNYYQLSLSWEPYERNSDYLQFVASGLYNNVENMIVLAQVDSGTNHYTYANVQHQRNLVAGLQIEGQVGSLHGLIGSSYTHQYAEAGLYDAFNYTELSATLNYSWKRPGLQFSVFSKWTSQAKNIQPGIDGGAYDLGTLQSYDITDASISRYFFKRKVQVTAGVKNIFDVQTLIPSGVVGGSVSTHGMDGTLNFLPRRFFTTLNVALN